MDASASPAPSSPEDPATIAAEQPGFGQRAMIVLTVVFVLGFALILSLVMRDAAARPSLEEVVPQSMLEPAPPAGNESPTSSNATTS